MGMVFLKASFSLSSTWRQHTNLQPARDHASLWILETAHIYHPARDMRLVLAVLQIEQVVKVAQQLDYISSQIQRQQLPPFFPGFQKYRACTPSVNDYSTHALSQSQPQV